jgi:SAM-dependent methyltransferase
VLELGCGSGNALPGLRTALRPRSLVGVDLDTRHGVVGDARSLPFRDRSFDLVVDFGTCQHAGAAALVEVARVLRPGGLLVHETRWAQRLAHPRRGGQSLEPLTELVPVSSAGLWALRRRAAEG